MGESGSSKLKYEKDIMKETLCTQQQLLHKLYNELEAEREASSSAASEAMAVILRLQGEKAAVQMEAEQYKRLAEEKMCYAEESLSIFEDIMYQKEVELSSLEAQVQAYRDKLKTLGFDDEQECSSERIEMAQTSLKSLARRNSAPSVPLKSVTKKSLNEEESCASSTRAKVVDSSTNELSSDSSNAGGIVSYMEQMRKLDRRVKEIAGVSYLRTRSPSPVSQTSGPSCDPFLLHSKLKAIVHDKEKGNVNKNSAETEEVAKETGGSPGPGVLDVFEVPQADHRYDDTQLMTRNHRKRSAPDVEEEEFQFHKVDITEQAVKSSNQDENYWLNRVMKSSNKEKEICVPSDDAIEVNMAMLSTTSIPSVSLHMFQQQVSSQASGIVEFQEQTMRQEGMGREEELKLLREIKDQISSLQREVNSLKPKETAPPTPAYEPSVELLREAMIYFWM